MKEYEISNNDKVLGKVNIYNEHIKQKLSNTLIESNKGMSFYKVNESDYQTYELEYKVNNVDDLFDIISKYIYDNDKIFDVIEEVKEYNNIKSIKKDTNIKIVVPSLYLSKLNKSVNDIDLNSLFLSKVYFVKSCISSLNNDYVLNLNNVINEYNGYINSQEYEFLTDDERRININKYLIRIDDLISNIENNTNYKYGKDYIIPIKINNN